MAYDEGLASRIRQVFTGRSDIEEKAMFGGLAFMARGHMCCGLVQSRLMIRVDPDSYDHLLREPDVQPMDFTGRPMRGFLYVNAPGISTASALKKWLARALDFAESQPPKSRRGDRKRSGMRRGKGLPWRSCGGN